MFKLSILSLASLISICAFADEGGGGGYVMHASDGGGGGYVMQASDGGGGGYVMQASDGGGGGGYVMHASTQLYPVSAIRQHGSIWLVQVFDGQKTVEAIVTANQLVIGAQGEIYAQVVSAAN